jgi:hypothetical protein
MSHFDTETFSTYTKTRLKPYQKQTNNIHRAISMTNEIIGK